QERIYPGRVSGTGLKNPDFAALARAYGGHGELVEKTEDFAAAFQRCRDFDGPSLIELHVDPEAILPGNTLSALSIASSAKN
ncbi:MAG: thiamine pyrophosphate-dependent enzyme, partial [Rhodospirillales bacterium]|nr:thiamine pyrophosphate-dependent enzyme [Rhodospirillales bacterium]